MYHNLILTLIHEENVFLILRFCSYQTFLLTLKNYFKPFYKSLLENSRDSPRKRTRRKKIHIKNLSRFSAVNNRSLLCAKVTKTLKC